MPLRDPFKKVQPNPMQAQPAPTASRSVNNNRGGGGGGGGGNKKKKQPPGTGGAATGGITVPPGSTPPPPTDDPAGWIRGQLALLGYAPEGDLGAFFDTRITNPFVAGWDAYKAAGNAGTFQDYIYTQPWAIAGNPHTNNMAQYVAGLLDKFQPMAASDPGGWLTGKMRDAGITMTGPYAAFWNEQVIQPFMERWAAYQAGGPDRGFGDFQRLQPWSQPPTASGNAEVVYRPVPPPPASGGITGFERGGRGGGRPSVGLAPMRMESGVGGGSGNVSSGAPGSMTPSPSTGNALATGGQGGGRAVDPFLAYLQSIRDRFSDEQRGLYDAGKDKSSTRWSVYG